MKFYNYHGRAIPVDVHLEPTLRYTWTRIFGLSIGSFFFGYIRGGPVA